MNTTPLPPQRFGPYTARVVRSISTGERFIRSSGHAHPIPLDIARLAAGPDAWLRQVVVKCSYCDNRQPVGETESGTCCQKCYDEAGEENARADQAHYERQADETSMEQGRG